MSTKHSVSEAKKSIAEFNTFFVVQQGLNQLQNPAMRWVPSPVKRSSVKRSKLVLKIAHAFLALARALEAGADAGFVCLCLLRESTIRPEFYRNIRGPTSSEFPD